MRLWIDTEFNSFEGELISMALVDEAGNFWYGVLEHYHMDLHPWVEENVMPYLGDSPKRKFILQNQLAKFLAKYESIHIIADWPQDIAHFMEFLITGPGHRLGTPPLTAEVRRDLDASGSGIPHNALADAIALRNHDLSGAPPKTTNVAVLDGGV